MSEWSLEKAQEAWAETLTALPAAARGTLHNIYNCGTTSSDILAHFYSRPDDERETLTRASQLRVLFRLFDNVGCPDLFPLDDTKLTGILCAAGDSAHGARNLLEDFFWFHRGYNLQLVCTMTSLR